VIGTKSKDRFDMKPTRMRLVRVAAVLTAIAIAAPVSTAAAATATVTPQTFVTTTPTTFINYNSQTSSAAISSGSQIAG
jgi:hypothetical protein